MMDVRLFILVLLCLALQGAASQASPAGKVANCTKTYLVTVENKTDGINVFIFSQNVVPGKVTAQQPQNQKIETKTVYGHFLSPECGADFFRCRKLMVVSSSLNQIATQHIVFVPLANGILLLELKFNGTNLHFSRHYILPIAISCSPTTVVQILHGIYVICMNTKSGYLSAHEIYLNKTVVANTWVSAPLVHMDFSKLGINLSTVTNFVHVNLDANASSQFIYFAVAGSLYALVPPVYLLHYVSNLANCVRAEKLVYAGRKTLIVYCYNSSAVNFDIEFEDWINQTSYDERGKPYVCPNQNIRLAVFSRASYIQYGLWSQNTLENINIPGLEFDSGVCFGTQDETFFAYNSREDGIYVLELATASLHHVSPSDNSVYEPVMVFKNRYLIIQERCLGDSSIVVVDSQRNFSVLIEGQHAKTDFVTLLEDIDLKCASESIPGTRVNINDNEIPTDMAERPPNTALIVSTTTILSALIIIAVLCVAIFTYHRRSRYRHGPVQQASTSDDEAYQPLSAKLGCQTSSMHTGHGPAYVTLQVSTHVYNEQQNKTASQGGKQVFEAKKIESPVQQKPTTGNGLVASSVSFPTIATTRKHTREVRGSATGNADATATGVVEGSNTKTSEQGAQEVEMATMNLSSSYEDSIIIMDESCNGKIPIQEAGVHGEGHSSLVEDLELGAGNDTDPLLPMTES